MAKKPEPTKEPTRTERVNVSIKQYYKSNEHPEKTAQERIRDRGTSRQQWMLFVILLLGVGLVVWDAKDPGFQQPEVLTVPLGYAMSVISLIGLAGREVAAAIGGLITKFKGK